MKTPISIRILLVTIAACSAYTQAGEFDLQLEGGPVWFSQNEVRIPGAGGTTFDMLDLTGDGPDPYIRFHATYGFNRRHALRLTIAPLETTGTGNLDKPVTFRNDVFSAGVPTKGSYQFNTYRLTYRWMFNEGKRWRWGVGAAALIRDAEITLEQDSRRQTKDDLGLVPLLHFFGACEVNAQVSLLVDIEGAWSPMGRAIDAAFQTQYEFDSGWYASAGYRTLEGGADNDEVYTFAWLHYALVMVGRRF